jgi:hypothetical protein
MAEESIPRQTFQCRDLTTKSVTLYPSRAHVVREIPNITLQSGQNEVEIYGLGPMVDEDSIQIEGRGQATITDITIDLVPNRESFFDKYPEEDEESDDDDDDDLDDELPEAVRKLDQEIEEITMKAAAAREAENSAKQQLVTLDKHVSTMHAKDHDASSAAAMVNMYNKERDRIYLASSKSGSEAKKLEEQLGKKQLARLRANKDAQKKKLKTQKAKAKEREKRERQRADKRAEAARIRKEHEKFWPNKVYKVVVRLETTVDTPNSSRRNSLDSVTLSKATPEDLNKIRVSSKLEVSLSMSYITNSAFWTPRYDFKIDTVQKSATIVYRAELSNGTSETWKDAKIILSTSQTSFSGLDDKVPTMHPWRVRVGKSWEAGNSVQSTEEMSRRVVATKSKAKRMNMGFSVGRSSSPRPSAAPQAQQLLSQAESLQQGIPMQSQVQALGGGGNQPWTNHAPGTRFYPDGNSPQHFGAVHVPSQEPDMDDGVAEEVDDEALDFEESTWEDCGLTATYDLPGARTLAPSSLPRRHKIATLQASNIAMSHIAVPKLKAAAYLRCKIRNPSGSVTLLKGQAGITLDGSFLGTTPLDRISPNQFFTIPLGVDPAIHISYPKPASHRSTQGLFSKENATLHSRSALITNTKATTVELLVLDQAPVSQDEKLRVDIVEPRGLVKPGDAVKAGAPATEGKAAWGKATATLKKDGEVAWLVIIEKGQSCVLKLAYETKLPSSDAVVTV